MKLRAQNNQSKLAKAKRQIGIKLHNEYRFVDKQARLQLKKIEKEQEEVAAEIRKTHQTRIDNSNVYVGVLPHITKKPRVKPLPNDMEYIRELVARKHKKWKKREEITMVQLVATIRRKLDILIEPYLPADKGSSAAVTDHGAETKGECEGALKCNKKTHFVPPLPKSYQLQPVSPKQKNLAMTNNEENQKPLSAERKKEERKLGLTGGRRMSPQKRKSPEYEPKTSEEDSLKLKYIREDNSTRTSANKEVGEEDDEFVHVYRECSKSRYLRKKFGSPKSFQFDITMYDGAVKKQVKEE